MKKLVLHFVVILLIGFVYPKKSLANDNYYQGDKISIISIATGEVGDFGYTYLGTLDWKYNTKEPATMPGGWVYIWERDGYYYWSGDRHPGTQNEIKRIYKDDIGYYIYYYGDKKAYLSYVSDWGYPLVTNIEKQVSRY